MITVIEPLNRVAAPFNTVSPLFSNTNDSSASVYKGIEYDLTLSPFENRGIPE